MRLCVIGNSHVGALKDSVSIVESSGIFSSVTFFAKGSDGMSDLIADTTNYRLVARSGALRRSLELTSGGLSEIDPEAYDIFLIYGLGLYPYFRHNKFVSEQLSDAHLADTFKNTLAHEVLSQLRHVTDKMVVLGHTPMKAAEIEKDQEIDPEYLKNIELMNSHESLLSYKATVISQPLDTICNKRSTKPDFTRGSVRMASGHANDGTQHPDNDLTHMNKAFGQLWWENLFQQLSR